MTEVNAGDVMDKYIAVLQSRRTSAVQDVEVLPYPKDLIKLVLKRCIETMQDAELKKTLKVGYIALADFQPLSLQEIRAVAIMSGIGELGPIGSDLLAKQTSVLAEATPHQLAAMERANVERDVLLQDVIDL